MDRDDDLVAGIERDIIEQFLFTFRDLYGRADEANYFLELKGAVSGINIAITNQRDALSHLVTVLNNPDWTRPQKLEQLHNAEEHLRRAILEPYERATAVQYERLLATIDHYKVIVLGRGELGSEIAHPTLTDLREQLADVDGLREKGRRAKLLNRVSPAWEEGIKSLVLAFQRLHRLETQLEELVVEARARTRAENSRERSGWPLTAFWAFVGGFTGWLVLSWILKWL